jgi:hypothetical protein
MEPGRGRKKLRGAGRRSPQGGLRQSAWEELGQKPRQGPCWQTLEGRSPREQPAASALNLRRSRGTLGRAKAQKPRPVGPAHRLRRREHRQVKRYVGASARKRGGYLSRGESSEGRIPRAPPVRNRTGTGSEGASRHEGNQTLKAERSGRWQRPRQVDFRTFECCRERKPMRGARRPRPAG